MSETPWKKATTTRTARRSEREGAKADGGRVTPMSGAGRQKGDYRANGWLVEDKVTETRCGQPAKSFSITAFTIEKTIREAADARLLPMWRITLPGHKLRVMREEDYLYLQAQVDRDDNEA